MISVLIKVSLNRYIVMSRFLYKILLALTQCSKVYLDILSFINYEINFPHIYCSILHDFLQCIFYKKLHLDNTNLFRDNTHSNAIYSMVYHIFCYIFIHCFFESLNLKNIFDKKPKIFP